MHANLFESGRAVFLSATDDEALAAAFEVAKLEGIIPALETAHAFASLKHLSLVPSPKAEGGPALGNKLNSSSDQSFLNIPEQAMFKKDSQVVICLSGRGDKDLATYMKAM